MQGQVILKTSRLRGDLPPAYNVSEIIQNERTAASKSYGSTYDRVKMIDRYVARKYLEVNIEYIVSCLGSVFWSVTGILHTSMMLPNFCLESNQIFFYVSMIILSLNVADMLSLFLIVYAPRNPSWRDRVKYLEFVIGTKLVLFGFNFAISLFSCYPKTCGYWYQMSELNDKLDMPSNFSGGHLVMGLRWYDVRVMGTYHLLTSVTQCFNAMLLFVKWNDIKMYVLWRMRKLENYIQDLFVN